jgi:hypothetical protein
VPCECECKCEGPPKYFFFNIIYVTLFQLSRVVSFLLLKICDKHVLLKFETQACKMINFVVAPSIWRIGNAIKSIENRFIAQILIRRNQDCPL